MGVPAPFSGGKVFRGFGLLGAIGLAFDLQDDRSFDQTIEEGPFGWLLGIGLASCELAALLF